VSQTSSVRIGTRGSALALAQARLVAEELSARSIASEIVIIETDGDRRTPNTAWGEGAFVTAIQRALVDGVIDVAVHSAKDVPTDDDARLEIAAYLRRDDPRDALVLPHGERGDLESLPPGTVIGTDSPRRTGFLRAVRPDLDVEPLHGNVDTRLRKLDDGVVGALVLAAAGLNRLGRADRISQLLDVDVVPPAAGQGAMAVQVRGGDENNKSAVTSIDDHATRLAVETERAFLAATGGGCRAPVGAFARVVGSGETIDMTVGFATISGRKSAVITDARPLAERLELARELARKIVLERTPRHGSRRVLLTRPAAHSDKLAARLAEHSVAAVSVPTIAIQLLSDVPEVRGAAARLSAFDWAVATSANGARAAAEAVESASAPLADVRWAALGAATARELERLGAREVWQPSQSNSETLARELPVSDRSAVVWFRGDQADDVLREGLTRRGARVEAPVAYRTIIGPPGAAQLLDEALDGGVDAVVFASPSAASGLVAVSGQREKEVREIPAICIGERTANAARQLGFRVAAVSSVQDATVVAELAAEIVSRDATDLTGAPR
jgi:hydroxymethylbilane synthase